MNVLLALSVALATFTSVEAQYSYDSDLAERFLDLAAATYLTVDQEDLRQKCFKKSFSDYGFVTKAVNTAPCDSNNHLCQMYVAYSQSRDTYVIAFRGTEGLGQLLQESAKSLNKYEIYTEYIANSPTRFGYINTYFGNAKTVLWDSTVKPSLTNITPNTTVFVTGHSLGGSIAALTAFKISAQGIVPAKNIRMISFGEPRTGDVDFSNIYKQYVPYSFRVTHYTDPIPHLPPMSGKTSGKPYHHPQEIWYNNKFSSYQVCSAFEGEDNSCSDKDNGWDYIKTVLDDEHLHYFNHYLPKYGVHGCSASSITLISTFIIAICRWLF